MLTPAEIFPNRLAGVIRASHPETAYRACVAAAEGGVGTVEVTTGVPDWEQVVQRLVADLGGVPVGVGTVVSAELVARAAAAGASFVVTPSLYDDVAPACQRYQLVCVMGALTPTEIIRAFALGADVCKVFPVAAMGGADYIRWFSGPYPGRSLWVSGGVEIDQIPDYLAAGVAAIGLTTSLFPPDRLAAGDFEGITGLARRAVTRVLAGGRV